MSENKSNLAGDFILLEFVKVRDELSQEFEITIAELFCLLVSLVFKNCDGVVDVIFDLVLGIRFGWLDRVFDETFLSLGSENSDIL